MAVIAVTDFEDDGVLQQSRKRAAAVQLEDVMQAFKRARARGPAPPGQRHPSPPPPACRKKSTRERDDSERPLCWAKRRRHCESDDEIEELGAERLAEILEGSGGGRGAAGAVLESALLERHVEERLEEATDELERRLQAQLLELQATVVDRGRRLAEQQEQLQEAERRLAEKAADLEAREQRHSEEVRRLRLAQAWQRQLAEAEYESLLWTMQLAEAEALRGRAGAASTTRGA